MYSNVNVNYFNELKFIQIGLRLSSIFHPTLQNRTK